MTPFRRDFDAEAVEIANGRRPSRPNTRPPGTTFPKARQPEKPRLVVIAAQTSEVRGEIEALSEGIVSAGGDWHIKVSSKENLDRVVAALQRRRIHGIILSSRRMR